MAIQANPLAIAKMKAKAVVGSVLNTKEWADVPLALRDAAFFSSEIEKLRFLQRAQDRIKTALEMARREGLGKDGGPGAFQTREKFIAELQKIAREEGLDPRNDPARADRAGTIQDPTSYRRLKLIWDQQIQTAQEFARWKAEQDPDVLDAYPAQEFIRVESRVAPRTDWAARWSEAGGDNFDGRMIALKNDPVWMKLSRFGTPYPPFDFGSGMGLRDVSREEAEALGLIKPGQRPEPAERGFNDTLEASVADLNPEYRKLLGATFGDAIDITGDVVKWKGR